MKNAMLLKVLGAMILAVCAGLITGPNMEIFGVPFLEVYTLIGQLFLNALNLVVVPLVASSIILGAARMGAEQSLGKLGFKTMLYFVGTTFLAIAVGWVLVMAFKPGLSQIPGAALVSASTNQALEVAQQAQGDAFQKISQIFLKVVPSNILAAASQGQMLGLIFFCLLFGFFTSKIESQSASIILGFWKGIFQIMMHITHLVMKALPIGVFGLVAKVIATMGLDTLGSVAYYSLIVMSGLFIHMFVVWPILLKTIAGINPIDHFRAVAPALFTAFSTSSTAATLPVTLECLEKRAGVSNRISSFMAPLGASLNLSGSALYVCIAVIFVAQMYGVQLSLATQVLVVLMTLLTSMGMAGIPSASMISVMLILHTIGVPSEGIGLILAVERILDMCRTVVNVFGTTCCTVMVARSEGEKDVLARPSEVAA